MKKNYIPLLFVLFGIQTAVSNFIHPVTPTMFQNYGYPDYMFGVAFAAMSVTNFIFCPIWGVVGDKIGHVKTLVIGTLGYGMGQVIFGIARTPLVTVLGRMFGGCFAASFFVAAMAYITNHSEPEKQASNMSYLAAITSMANAVGYLIGGVLGQWSIFWDFVVQVSLCAVMATLMLLLIKEKKPEPKAGAEQAHINPFKAFGSMAVGMSKPLLIFLAAAIFANFGTFNYDQTFNYFIKDQLGFPASYNGYIKALVGIIGLGVNLTINVWLARKTNMRKSIVWVFALASTGLLAMAIITQSLPLIFANVFFYIFNVMYMPMLQSMIAGDKTTNKTSGELSGIYNAVKAFGMVAGSLFAGFIYTVNANLPFYVGGASFAVAAVIAVFAHRAYAKWDAGASKTAGEKTVV